MSGVRTLEDFVRQRMTVDRSKRVTIGRREDGLFEASWVHADGKTATVDVDADPVTALWNSLVPFQMRRRLASGREAVVGDDVHGIDFKPDTSTKRVKKPAYSEHALEPDDDIDNLLGDTSPTATVDTDDELNELLG